jgi:hypothetical protein
MRDPVYRSFKLYRKSESGISRAKIMKTERPRNRIAIGQKIWNAIVLTRSHETRRILERHGYKG